MFFIFYFSTVVTNYFPEFYIQVVNIQELGYLITLWKFLFLKGKRGKHDFAIPWLIRYICTVFVFTYKRNESIWIFVVLSRRVRYLHTKLFIYNSKPRSQRMSLMCKVLTSSFLNVYMFSYFCEAIWKNSCII